MSTDRRFPKSEVMTFRIARIAVGNNAAVPHIRPFAIARRTGKTGRRSIMRTANIILLCAAITALFAAVTEADPDDQLSSERHRSPEEICKSVYDDGLAGSLSLTSFRDRDFQIGINYVGSTLWSGMQDAVIVGDYALCAMDYGLQIIDISDPESYSIVSKIYTDPGLRVAVSGSYACYLSRDMLRMIDISNLSNPIEIASLGLPAEPVGTAIEGDNLYVSFDNETLQVISIADRASPEIVGIIGLTYVTGDISAWENHVICARRKLRAPDSRCFRPGKPECGYHVPAHRQVCFERVHYR